MCAKDGGSTSFGSAATTKKRPSAIWTRTVSQGEASASFARHDSGPVALLPPRFCQSGQPSRVDEEVVEARAEELLREHVRVLAVAAGAVEDDRDRAVAALADERRHAGVDVALPDGKAPRARDVALLEVLRAARVQDSAPRAKSHATSSPEISTYGLLWGGKRFSRSAGEEEEVFCFGPLSRRSGLRGGLRGSGQGAFLRRVIWPERLRGFGRASRGAPARRPPHSPSKKLRTLPSLQSQQDGRGRGI